MTKKAGIIVRNSVTCPPGQLDAVASIRRGLAQARGGAGRPAEEVFDELERGAPEPAPSLSMGSRPSSVANLG
ncbi:MAG: hypothetical protein WAL71_04685 [Terriglobales bacterium]